MRCITCGMRAVTKDIVSQLMPQAGWLMLYIPYRLYLSHSSWIARQVFFTLQLQFGLQTGGEGNQVVTYGARFCDRVFERNVGDLGAA